MDGGTYDLSLGASDTLENNRKWSSYMLDIRSVVDSSKRGDASVGMGDDVCITNRHVCEHWEKLCDDCP